MIKNRHKFSSSFGLIEAVIAISILMMASFATTSIGMISIRGTNISKHRLEATMLAQNMLEQLQDNIYSYAGKNNWGNYWTETSGDYTFYALADNNFNKGCVSISNSRVDTAHNSVILQSSNCQDYAGYLNFRPTLKKETPFSFLNQTSPSVTGIWDYNPLINCQGTDFPYYTGGTKGQGCGNNPVINISNKAYKVIAEVTWLDYGQTQSVKLYKIFTEHTSKY